MTVKPMPDAPEGGPQRGAPNAAPPPAATRSRLLTLLQDRQPCNDAMIWLVSAVAAAPHIAAQPPTLAAVALLLWLWRAGIWLFGGRFPPRSLLFALTLALAGLVLLEYGTIAGRDPGAALMVVMLGMKQLENNGRRDALIALYLSIFLFLTQFLRDQSAFDLLWMFGGVLLLQLAWIQLYYVGPLPRWRTQIALTLRLTMIGVPIMVVLFLLVPRLALPSLQTGFTDALRAQVGFSGKMQFGSVSQLGESNEIAFRVKFDTGLPPSPAHLYWRGAVLERHDGRDWHADLANSTETSVPQAARLPGSSAEPGPKRTLASQGEPAAASPQAPPAPLSTPPRIASLQPTPPGQHEGATLGYTVELMPHDLDWLFALAPAHNAQLPSGVTLEPNIAGELRTLQPVRGTLRYRVVSGHRQTAAQSAPAPVTTGLTPGVSPRATWVARKLAASVTANLPADASPAESALLKLAALQKWMRDAGLRYTLNAPTLSGDLVDSFLFNTGAGFCEHFSASFAVMARAMDLPSRVVLGYQGGELNPLDGQLTVLQRHAHAWAEVWVEGMGWMHVDPVAWVAPERIDRGVLAEQRLRSRLGSLLPEGVGRQLEELRTRLRHIASAIRTGWNDWVLGYTLDRQQRLLSAVGAGPQRGTRVALVLALAIALPLLGLYLWRRFHNGHDPLAIDRAWHGFCRKLAAAGLPREPHEGPLAYAARVRDLLDPSAALTAQEIAQRYARLKYGAPAAHAEALTTALRAAVRRFRPVRRITADRPAP